jgi:hypothetical protein
MDQIKGKPAVAGNSKVVSRSLVDVVLTYSTKALLDSQEEVHHAVPKVGTHTDLVDLVQRHGKFSPSIYADARTGFPRTAPCSGPLGELPAAVIRQECTGARTDMRFPSRPPYISQSKDGTINGQLIITSHNMSTYFDSPVLEQDKTWIRRCHELRRSAVPFPLVWFWFLVE